MPKFKAIFTTMFVLLIPQATYAGPPSFTGLGFLPEDGTGPISEALGISADGSTVVGWSTSNSRQPSLTIEAFRWTSDTGMVGLGHLDRRYAFIYLSEARSVSADGSTAVGYSLSRIAPPNFEAVRWTTGTGIESLHIHSALDSFANAISDDGSTIVGYREVDREAFRWTAETGTAYLGDLPGGEFESTPYDVSADGSVIVGIGSSEFGPEAFRWTPEEEMVGLGFLPGGSFSYAYGVSADGSTIVGMSYSDFGLEAFRWTADGGMIGLGDLPGRPDYNSKANDVSADGSVIVGRGQSLLGYEAFLWDETNGMRNLKEVLTTDFGLDLAGWQLTEANAVSADGRTIVGNGINPDGFEEGWIAVVPEPSTFTLAGCGFTAIALAAWRRQRAARSSFPPRG